MKVLFIDTHKSEMTIILKNGEEETVISREGKNGHSEIVMPAIEEVFSRTGLSLDEIDLIVVVNGPGSFTGVRIGVTIAKTLAYTKKIPVKSITSLEMYGVSSSTKSDLVIVRDSKGVYSALYKDGEYTDFKYQRHDAFNEYVLENGYTVEKDEKINLSKILEFLETKEAVNPHILNPIYIKEIDALK